MIDFNALAKVSRLLMDAELTPAQGQRFQPTGFPDLGAAEYTRPDGVDMLLVESTQSMANRLESVCWDEATNDLVPALKGIPYVAIDAGDLGKSSSMLEFHRLNSPYIMGDEAFQAKLRNQLGLKDKKEGEEDVPGALDLRKLAEVVFRYDPGSVLHGVFLEKIAGRLRLQRALSAFIEAEDARRVESGGVKFDRLDPTGKASGGAEKGFGNVPHHRVEYTARKIIAYFNLDLSSIRGYGLPAHAENFLVVWSLWKIRKLLESGLRLRTACDFSVKRELQPTQPTALSIPATTELETQLKTLIAECKPSFASPPVTSVSFVSKKEKKK